MSSKAKSTGIKNDGQPALTPKLRFPEFQNAEEWEEEKLGIVCELYQPVTLTSSDLTMTGEYLVYGANGIIGSHDEYNHEESEIAVTCRGATCGEIKRTKPKSWITGNAMVVKPKAKKLRKDFIFHYFKNNGLKTVISGSAQPQITRAGFAPLPVFFPSPDEQQKIADCLSSVDELIAAQAQKVDALKTHKKGLMQQLFPREGETQPRLRFPEFQGAGEWEEHDLADLTYFQEGPGIMAVDFQDQGVPLVRLSGLTERSVSLDGCNYLDPEKVEKKWTHFRLEFGDILVSCSASFGRPAIVTDIAAGAVFYTGLIRFKPKNARLDASYLEVFLGSPCFLRQAESAAVGGGIKHFGPTHLRQMTVPRPPKTAEQQRIADCLTSLDELIVAETQKHEAIKTHKKGLMQQLFPSPEEAKA